MSVEDFESPILGGPGYTPYALSGGTNLGSGGWTFQGLCGIGVNGAILPPASVNGAPLSPYTTEDGQQQFAYLQSGTTTVNGQQVMMGSDLSLDVVPTNGKMYITIRAVQRAGNTSPQVMDVWIDRNMNGQGSGLHPKPKDTYAIVTASGGYQPKDVYEEVTFPAYIKPGVSHRIEIMTAAPLTAGEDKTAFIDEIEIYCNRPPVAHDMVVNTDAASLPIHWSKPATFNLDVTDPDYPGMNPPPLKLMGSSLGSVKPSHGTVTFSYGRCTYTPVLQPGEDPLTLTYTDTFTYTVTDNYDIAAQSNEASVTVNIQPDHPPTLSAAGAALPVDTETGLSIIDVNLNSKSTSINIFPLGGTYTDGTVVPSMWTDPDGDVLTVEDSVGKGKKAKYGNAKRLNLSTVTYITFTIDQSKAAGLNGKRPPIGTSDMFDYTIVDGNGGKTTGLIRVNYVQ